MHTVRRIAVTRAKGFDIMAGVARGQGERARASDVRLSVGKASIELEMRIARLSYAARVTASAPQALLGLLQSSAHRRDSWTAQLLDDLQALADVMHDKLRHMPAPRLEPWSWE